MFEITWLLIYPDCCKTAHMMERFKKGSNINDLKIHW